MRWGDSPVKPMSETPLTVGSLFSGIPSAALTSDSNAPVCRLCGSASRTTTAAESLPGIGPESPAIPTCAPLWPTPCATDEDGSRGKGSRGDLLALIRQTKRYASRCPCRCHTSTSSAAASPARTSPTPARAQASTGSARVFGPSTPASFASFDPGTSSWRTSQLCLDGDLDEFSETWPRWGTTQNGVAYAPQTSERPTAATESGSWPTPRVAVLAGKAKATKTHGWDLPAAVKDSEESEPSRQWPTPTARLGAQRGAQAPGQLNPTWVEWLQGFPLGWTEVGGPPNPTSPESPTASQTGWTDLQPSGTPSSPRSRNGSASESSSTKRDG
jgi:hypothetical protein